MTLDRNFLCVLEGGAIPTVAESQYGGVGWHDVQNQVVAHPAADRRTFVLAFAETELPELFPEFHVFSVGCVFYDSIHVIGRPEWSCVWRRRGAGRKQFCNCVSNLGR